MDWTIPKDFRECSHDVFNTCISSINYVRDGYADGIVYRELFRKPGRLGDVAVAFASDNGKFYIDSERFKWFLL